MKRKRRANAGGRPLHLTFNNSVLKQQKPLITLLTDFGTRDYFVGAMKGTILSVNPEVLLIDISHDIPAQDIEAAAFTLLASYQSFPAGTIHVAVVDPGVGSSRRPMVLQMKNYFFVGPDNGIFSYVCDNEEAFKVFHLTNEQYFRLPVSTTFHGRDIFAPVAAALSLGVNPRKLGDQIVDPVRLEPLRPKGLRKRLVSGRVIHIDRFGNCITNIRPEDFENVKKLEVGGHTIKSFKQSFEEGSREKVFGIWGSAGFLELAVTNGSAAKILKVNRGQPVLLHR